MYTLETLLLLRRCINFEDYALILFVFDLQLCIVVDCVIRIGVRQENSTPFRFLPPKFPQLLIVGYIGTYFW